jgi:heme/copper-type cytochrome/quinol oxidase subunit 4
LPTYKSPVTVIILSIVTCGIYYIYWAYQTNEEIKRLSGNVEEVSTAMVILGCLCGPLGWFNWYKWDKALQSTTAASGQTYETNFILWVVLTIAAGVGLFMMEYQVQDYINRANGLSA